MFDCNGSNTTAAAAVAWLAHGRSLEGKRAVVLAGTRTGRPARRGIARARRRRGRARRPQIRGRASGLRGDQGALWLRNPRRSRRRLTWSAAPPSRARISCSPPAPPASPCCRRTNGRKAGRSNSSRDANASPPAGIEGVSMGDRGTQSHGKILFGPLGFGALKLALHRACIARLFEANDLAARCRRNRPDRQSMVGLTSIHAELDRQVSRASRERRSHPGRRQRRGDHGRHGCRAGLHGVQRLHRQEGPRSGPGRAARTARALRSSCACALTAMVAEDVAAFGSLMAAYKLPKASELTRRGGREAIQAGLRLATEVPLDCARVCASVIGLCAPRRRTSATRASSATWGRARDRLCGRAQRRAQRVHQCTRAQGSGFRARVGRRTRKLLVRCAVESEAAYTIVCNKLEA